jgi:hypothetical protein
MEIYSHVVGLWRHSRPFAIGHPVDDPVGDLGTRDGQPERTLLTHASGAAAFGLCPAFLSYRGGILIDAPRTVRYFATDLVAGHALLFADRMPDVVLLRTPEAERK